MTRSNSTEAAEAEGGLARGHRVAVFAGALVASAGCFAAVPGDTLTGSLAQTALLAAVALVAVGLSHPQVLRAPRGGVFRGLRVWIGYVLAVGLAAGVATTVGFGGEGAAPATDALADGEPAGWLLLAVQVTVLCLLTGVFEEGVFRVLALDAFALAFGGGRNGVLRAAFASAVLFGLLHVSAGQAGQAGDAVAAAQLMLKPVQAGLFGFFMAAVYVATRNLWMLAGVHAAFNLLSTGPLLFAGGMQQTYVTGSLFDLALLAGTVVLLIPPAVFAFWKLRGMRA